MLWISKPVMCIQNDTCEMYNLLFRFYSKVIQSCHFYVNYEVEFRPKNHSTRIKLDIFFESFYYTQHMSIIYTKKRKRICIILFLFSQNLFAILNASINIFVDLLISHSFFFVFLLFNNWMQNKSFYFL